MLYNYMRAGLDVNGIMIRAVSKHLVVAPVGAAVAWDIAASSLVTVAISAIVLALAVAVTLIVWDAVADVLDGLVDLNSVVGVFDWSGESGGAEAENGEDDGLSEEHFEGVFVELVVVKSVTLL